MSQLMSRLDLLETEALSLRGTIGCLLADRQGGAVAEAGLLLSDTGPAAAAAFVGRPVGGGQPSTSAPILLAYDTETPYTGGRAQDKTLLQIAAVPLDPGVPQFEAVVPNESNVSQEDESQCLRAFFIYILKLEVPVVLLAHNGKRFDSHVIIGAARRGRIIMPPNLYGHLDTLDVLRVLNPESEAGHSLDAVCALYNVTIKDRHTALGDAVALAETMRIASRHPKWNETSRRLLETHQAAMLRVNRIPVKKKR